MHTIAIEKEEQAKGESNWLHSTLVDSRCLPIDGLTLVFRVRHLFLFHHFLYTLIFPPLRVLLLDNFDF